MNNRFPPTNLQENIYALIAFFDIFERPVRLEDLKKVVTEKESKIIDDLNGDARISSRDGWYFMKGRDGIVDITRKKRGINERFWKRADKFIPFLYKLPFIKSVFVCNTLSFDNCDEDSDIDLFIIVRNGRIFMARTLATLIMHLLGVRRHGKKIAGRFCLSFFATEEMYAHIDDVALKPVDPYFFYWKKFLKIYEQKRKSCVILNFILKGRFGDKVERLLEKKHMERYEKRKKNLGPESDVVVCREMLKFHNKDKRRGINAEFAERYDLFF